MPLHAYRIVGQVTERLPDGREVMYHTIATASRYGVVRIVAEADGSLTKATRLGLTRRGAVEQVIAWKKEDGTYRGTRLVP